MRQAFTDVLWLMRDNGQLAGVSLGFDFCAEHEHGVSRMKAALGVKDGLPRGLADRRITCSSDVRLDYFDVKPHDKRRKAVACAVMSLNRYPSEAVKAPQNLPAKLFRISDEPIPDDLLQPFWDENGFRIEAFGATSIARLEQVYAAVKAGGATLSNCASLGFSRSAGVAIGLLDQVPAEIQAQVLESDLERIELDDAFEASGIEKRLKAAGRRWFALCSPRWQANEFGHKRLLLWLNPVDQRGNHSGWFSIEELEQWAEGKGPVLIDAHLESRAKEEMPDWHFNLVRACNTRGVPLRGARLVWFDAERTILGVDLVVGAKNQFLSSGLHSWASLEEQLKLARKTLVVPLTTK